VTVIGAGQKRNCILIIDSSKWTPLFYKNVLTGTREQPTSYSIGIRGRGAVPGGKVPGD